MGVIPILIASNKKGPVIGAAPSYLKNPRNLQAGETTYDAFGFTAFTGTDRVTHFFRSGTSHLVGGNVYARHYTPSTDTWGAKFLIESDSIDCRDVWGGVMDNGEVMLFTSRSYNGVGGTSLNTIDQYYLRGNATTMVFGSRVSIFAGTGLTQLDRGECFGRMAQGANPGEYYMPCFQWMNDGSQILVTMLKTTDYWHTINHYQVYSGTAWFTEGMAVYLGGSKLGLFCRNDYGGLLYYFESNNNGVTWSDWTQTTLGWDLSAGTIIPGVYRDGPDVYVLVQDRGTGFIAISKNSVSSINWAFPMPLANIECYFYNKTTSPSNPALGYPTMLKLDGSHFLMLWSRETDIPVANVWYTLDDLVTDNGLPAAPPAIAASFITSSGFRLDMTGYTQAQLNNIRYWQFDLSTAADFSSYVTANYNSPLVTGAVLHNIRMPALWIQPSGVETVTTYYARIRAVNNNGSSSYTAKTITTT